MKIFVLCSYEQHIAVHFNFKSLKSNYVKTYLIHFQLDDVVFNENFISDKNYCVLIKTGSVGFEPKWD